jgi:4-amino-4-deoxy-L-arabinose transferase-like glycosyltransferase
MNRSSIFNAAVLSDAGILIVLALLRVLLQIPTNGQYGFHQDELVTMDIATRHLAWGYVAWPPVTPFLARVALVLFGPSLIGLRSFAVLAEGLVVLLAGLMIRDLGGGRWAQILGAVAVATTPNSIIQGGLFQYETLDYLCWVLPGGMSSARATLN